jgi:hypothetical protein
MIFMGTLMTLIVMILVSMGFALRSAAPYSGYRLSVKSTSPASSMFQFKTNRK